MSGTAIPQSDGALLAAQAKAGQAGLDAYEAAKAQMSSNRTNAISGALSAAESRGAPNAAMQSTLAGAEQVYDQRQASLTGAEAAYQDAMASRSQRSQDYQGAIQGARGLIADQAWQAVQPIKAQSDFQINQLRQSGENRVSEINANQALTSSRMTAEQAARQQQYDLDLARYQEEKRLDLERYQEQMRLEAERFERQFQASYSRGSGGGDGGGSNNEKDDREEITSQGDLESILKFAALNGLTAAQAFAITAQQDSINAYDKRNELIDARSGGRLKPGFEQSQTMNSQASKPVVPPMPSFETPMPSFETPASRPGFVQSQTMNPQAPHRVYPPMGSVETPVPRPVYPPMGSVETPVPRPVVPPMPSFETPMPSFETPASQSRFSVPRSSVQQTPQSTFSAPRSSVQPQGPAPSVPRSPSVPSSPSVPRSSVEDVKEAYRLQHEQYLQNKQDEERLDWLRTDFNTRVSNSEYSDLLGTVPEFDFGDPSGAENAFGRDVSALQRAYELELPGLRENFDFKDSSFINAMSNGNYENPNDIISRSQGRGDTASQDAAKKERSNAAIARITSLSANAAGRVAANKAQKKEDDAAEKATNDQTAKDDISRSSKDFREATGSTPTEIFGEGTDPRAAYAFVLSNENLIEESVRAINNGEIPFKKEDWLEANSSGRYSMMTNLASLLGGEDGFDIQQIEYQNLMHIILSRLVGFAE